MLMYFNLSKRKNEFEAKKLNNGVVIIFLIVSLIFLFSLAYNNTNDNTFITTKTTQTKQTPH